MLEQVVEWEEKKRRGAASAQVFIVPGNWESGRLPVESIAVRLSTMRRCALDAGKLSNDA